MSARGWVILGVVLALVAFVLGFYSETIKALWTNRKRLAAAGQLAEGIEAFT